MSIDFTPKEVEEFLFKHGYTCHKVNLDRKTRVIIGNDGGGGVELSNEFITDASEVIAISMDESLPTTLVDREYEFLPDVVFRRLLKNKLLYQ